MLLKLPKNFKKGDKLTGTFFNTILVLGERSSSFCSSGFHKKTSKILTRPILRDAKLNFWYQPGLFPLKTLLCLIHKVISDLVWNILHILSYFKCIQCPTNLSEYFSWQFYMFVKRFQHIYFPFLTPQLTSSCDP